MSWDSFRDWLKHPIDSDTNERPIVINWTRNDSPIHNAPRTCAADGENRDAPGLQVFTDTRSFSYELRIHNLEGRLFPPSPDRADEAVSQQQRFASRGG